MTSLLLPLGLGAGALTTVAGLGGGQVLILVLAAVVGPVEALAISAPALLAGNTHRLWMYRRHADWRHGLAFAAGALPGSLVGGFLTAGLPPRLLSAILLGTTALAVARALGLWTWRPRAAAFAPAGGAIGVVCATSSGAGLLLAPLLLSAGLSGAAYSATASLCAGTMHIGRLAGYGLGGTVSTATLMHAAVLGAAILAGNLLGDRARRVLPRGAAPWIEHGTLVACVALALVGVGR